MSTIFTSVLKTVPETHYRAREPNIIQRLFRERFPAFETAWEERYAAACGKYRLPAIQRAAEAYRLCGDWQEGIARVHCPDCSYDFFVPFSCKSFFLCPSCSQKRTLLLGEYLCTDLLLQLPHRQFVWTIAGSFAAKFPAACGCSSDMIVPFIRS